MINPEIQILINDANKVLEDFSSLATAFNLTGNSKVSRQINTLTLELDEILTNIQEITENG